MKKKNNRGLACSPQPLSIAMRGCMKAMFVNKEIRCTNKVHYLTICTGENTLFVNMS
jgi:hypothetical protein